jgi:hypothetical protein
MQDQYLLFDEEQIPREEQRNHGNEQPASSDDRKKRSIGASCLSERILAEREG